MRRRRRRRALSHRTPCCCWTWLCGTRASESSACALIFRPRAFSRRRALFCGRLARGTPRWLAGRRVRAAASFHDLFAAREGTYDERARTACVPPPLAHVCARRGRAGRERSLPALAAGTPAPGRCRATGFDVEHFSRARFYRDVRRDLRRVSHGLLQGRARRTHGRRGLSGAGPRSSSLAQPAAPAPALPRGGARPLRGLVRGGGLSQGAAL